MGLEDLRKGKRGPVTVVVKKEEGWSWILKGGVSLARWKGVRRIPGEEGRGVVLAKAQRRIEGCVHSSSRDGRARHAAGSHNVSVFSGKGEPMLLKLLNRCQQ